MTQRARATIYLDPRVFRALKIKAASSGCSVSAIVGDALTIALREDMIDLAAVKQRSSGPAEPFEKVLKELKRDGLL